MRGKNRRGKTREEVPAEVRGREDGGADGVSAGDVVEEVELTGSQMWGVKERQESRVRGTA